MMIEDDEFCTHRINYLLGREDSTYDENSETKVSVTCVACRFPTYVCHKIQSKLIEHVTRNKKYQHSNNHIKFVSLLISKYINKEKYCYNCYYIDIFCF